MKRLCIYLTYDKEKIIDKYIGYMLNELKTCAAQLVVVCNMREVVRGKRSLENYADEIFYRENSGFDAGGFKDALCNYLGWDKVYEYDELILVNDSIFGPFKPMKCIFAEMDNYKVDFWGLAAHGECGEEIPKHIQTYFIVVRTKMLHDISFKMYWENMPFYTTFSEVVYQHEVKFTSYFERMGYVFEVLADTKINDSKIAPLNNYMQYAFISYELIKKRNFPFLKKQQLAYNILSLQTQENLYQAIHYVDKYTDYDVELIWENIIRTLNMADLQRSLHLQYIISSGEKEPTGKHSIIIVICAEHKEAAAYVMDYVESLGQESGLFIQIISENSEIIEFYKTHAQVENRLTFKEHLNIFELSQYDLVCVLHDADLTSDVRPSYNGKSYFYCIWENLFRDKNHILGIVEKFEQENRLGFLAPPEPNFADYFGQLGNGWGDRYEKIKGVSERLQLQCPISEETPPFCITEDFWIRGSILQCLEKISPEEISCLPYLWSYFAQHMGYYSGIVESTDYASMNEVNMQYYLNEIADQVKRKIGSFKDFDEMGVKIASIALNLFCENHPRLLIYGAGYYAKIYKSFLLKAEACIVSDGQKRAEFFEGIPIRYLKEIRNPEECGVVVCVNKKNQKQVIPFLRQYGITDYICIL